MTKRTNEAYSLLYDFYGALLTERQRETFELYYEENYSFSEIAESLGISRQAVHIAVNKARDELDIYEVKLGLIAKHAEYQRVLIEVETKTDAILKDKERVSSLEPEVAKDLRRFKKLIKGLDI